MEEHMERLTLGVDAETKRRLKAAAAAKGVSVSVYCRAAIDRELAEDETEAESRHSQKKLDAIVTNMERLLEESRGTPAEPALEMLMELHRKYPPRAVTTKTAVDYIREGREIRDRQMDEWLKPRKTSSS